MVIRYSHLSNSQGGENKREGGGGAKVVKSLNKNHEEGGILQGINKRGGGKLYEKNLEKQ